MAIIDSDAHVIENDATWDCMEPADQQYRPIFLNARSGDQQYLVTDGKFLIRARKDTSVDLLASINLGDQVPVPNDSRLMLDVEVRLRHMDELGTDVQVLYPTIFIMPVAERPETELAMCRAYNRWMAQSWAKSSGRLPWALVPPLLSMEKTLEELRTAKDNGACAIFMRPMETGGRLLDDPYFYPMYEEASRLGLPICPHAGNGSQQMIDASSGYAWLHSRCMGAAAFYRIVNEGLPDKFPELRWGFIEFTGNWLPFAVTDLARRFERRGIPRKENVLRDNRIYVACHSNDDIPYLEQCVGPDNLLMGTDYGHADLSTEIHALENFKANSGVSAETTRKILDDNPRALYGL